MEQNKFKLYNEQLNQWNDRSRFYQCTFYSMAVNLSYNCWIKLTKEDIDSIAKIQNEAGLFSYTEWWRWIDWANAVLKFIRDNSQTRGWKIPQLIQLADDNSIMNYLNNWYAVVTWISVNKQFIQDVPDWTIDTLDYKSLAWNDLKHYLNMIIQNWGWLVDNYAWNSQWRQWLYQCDISQVLEDLTQHIKYVFTY